MEAMKIRTYTGLVLMLSASRSKPEAVTIADQAYDRIRSIVTENPKYYGVGCVDAYLHIAKV